MSIPAKHAALSRQATLLQTANKSKDIPKGSRNAQTVNATPERQERRGQDLAYSPMSSKMNSSRFRNTE